MHKRMASRHLLILEHAEQREHIVGGLFMLVRILTSLGGGTGTQPGKPGGQDLEVRGRPAGKRRARAHRPVIDPQQPRGQREAPRTVKRRDVSRGTHPRGQRDTDRLGGGWQVGPTEHPPRGNRARPGIADPPAQRDRPDHDDTVPRQPGSVTKFGLAHTSDFTEDMSRLLTAWRRCRLL